MSTTDRSNVTVRITNKIIFLSQKVKLDIKSFLTRMRQRKLLIADYSPTIQKLIMFLTPGFDNVNGGIISITSLYNETHKIRNVLGAEVIMCTAPGEPNLIRFSKFDNQNYLYDMQQALSYFTNLNCLMIHIPEYAVGRFVAAIGETRRERFQEIGDVRFNILLQNIGFVPNSLDIDILKKIGKVTCTTAHESYSKEDLERRLGVRLRYLSWYVSLQDYEKQDYREKSNLLVVSNDPHPRKKEILSFMRTSIPNLEIRVIKDIHYDEYRKLIARAKWTLTFGEGLDGYFLETVFAGGISFAVYNTEFFTDDFRGLKTVYHCWDELKHRICSDIESLDNASEYAAYNAKLYDVCNRHYNPEIYRKGIDDFYAAEWMSSEPHANQF